MEYVRLGKSNLLVSRISMGAMNLEKIGSTDEASGLIREAYNQGINFFDTARNKEGSEKTLGDAVYDIRANVVVATKFDLTSVEKLLEDIEISLKNMRTDYIDLFQFESNERYPVKDGEDGLYNTVLKLKEQGKINHIGLVTEEYDIAVKAVKSGYYETIQFPFSMISPEEVHSLLKLCDEQDVGFIAMRPLCGGIVENIPLAYGFLHQFENVIPLWGVQSKEELDQILYFDKHHPVIDEKFHQDIEQARLFFN